MIKEVRAYNMKVTLTTKFAKGVYLCYSEKDVKTIVDVFMNDFPQTRPEILVEKFAIDVEQCYHSDFDDSIFSIIDIDNTTSKFLPKVKIEKGDLIWV